MFAVFCAHADKNHIYSVLTTTTGPLRANIMLIWHLVKMSLTPLLPLAYGGGRPLCHRPVATGGHSGAVPPKFLLCLPKFSCFQKNLF